MILLILTGIFLIVLILIQRGKGGGLAGAFGGMGGQSAFGTKAGDLFTRITIGAAAFWIILCIVSVRLMGTTKEVLNLGSANPPGNKARLPAPRKSSPLPWKTARSKRRKTCREIPSTPSKSQVSKKLVPSCLGTRCFMARSLPCFQADPGTYSIITRQVAVTAE